MKRRKTPTAVKPRPPVRRQPAADTGAEDHREHQSGPGRGTVDGFGQRQTVGVVGEA